MNISDKVTAQQVDTIHTSQTFQVRTKLNQEHVEALVLAEAFSPIVVGSFSTSDGRSKLFVVDGHHRLEAAKRMGHETIEARVFKGTVSEAVDYAYQSNLRNGLPLTLPEKKSYALKLLSEEPGLSDREIGRRVGLDNKTVGNLRRGENKDSNKPTQKQSLSIGERIMKDILKLDPSEYTPNELGEEMKAVLNAYEYDDEREVLQMVIAGLQACL